MVPPPPPPSGPKVELTKAFVYRPTQTVQWLDYDEEFLITVTNSGTSASGAVTITDTLDPMLMNAFATLDPGNGSCSLVAEALTCTLPTIAVGQTRTVRIAYHLAFSPDGPGSLLNCATATDSTGKATQACSTLLYAYGPG